jgi:copper(I)-binding protein
MYNLTKNNCLMFLLISLLSFASSANDIVIIDAYMPEIPPVSRTAAVYLTLENKSTNDYELVAVSTPIARHSMVHQTIEKDGAVKMNHVDRLLVKANNMIKLTTGGTHIMLMGLTQKTIPNPFELTLVFNSLESEDLDSEKKEQTILVNVVKRKK